MDEPGPAGPVLFARYAYPPNALGYCGPPDAEGLLGAAARDTDVDELTARAAAFSGAWPYLRLIASSNGVADPLDRDVVDAYWVGNPLLDTVAPDDLAATVEAQLAAGHGRAPAGAGPVPPGGRAHHSFHVFAVYPWLELLRSGVRNPALTVLDRCRIRWGEVVAVAADTATVRSHALQFTDGRLELGAEQVEDVRRSIDGVGFVGDLAPGAHVSMHWDWVCERLTPPRLARLEAATAHSLQVVNTRS